MNHPHRPKLNPGSEQACCDECFKWGEKYGEYQHPCNNVDCECHTPQPQDSAPEKEEKRKVCIHQYSKESGEIKCVHCGESPSYGLLEQLKKHQVSVNDWIDEFSNLITTMKTPTGVTAYVHMQKFGWHNQIFSFIESLVKQALQVGYDQGVAEERVRGDREVDEIIEAAYKYVDVCEKKAAEEATKRERDRCLRCVGNTSSVPWKDHATELHKTEYEYPLGNLWIMEGKNQAIDEIRDKIKNGGGDTSE